MDNPQHKDINSGSPHRDRVGRGYPPPP
jgi:hypothetical protein